MGGGVRNIWGGGVFGYGGVGVGAGFRCQGSGVRKTGNEGTSEGVNE